MPDVASASLSQIFGDVDQNGKTRLVVLDPRRWTLHNGRDAPTRGDVAALLGVGDQALPVDNGASCVVACVNTQRRDNVRKRATEVLAWRAVIGQLDADDDKRREALAELRNATERVDTDLLKAFQHFAYLTRTDRVEVDWQRFDDDTKSALKGSHVWDTLVSNGRAVYPGKLSGDYLRTLLAKMPRALTLKEIGQQFYKNAAFPMVPSPDDIRRAVFQTLSGPGAYEVVDGNGEALTISSLDELSIGSMELSLRKATGAPEAGTQAAGTPASGSAPTPDVQYPTGTGQPHEGPGTEARPPQYRRYQMDVPNRSLVDPDTRRGLANLLQAVLDAVDPDTGGDIQLLDLQLNITADSAAVQEMNSAAGQLARNGQRKNAGTQATGTPPAGTASAPGSAQNPTGPASPTKARVPRPRPPQYRRYQLEVPNRSLVNPDTRRGLANLLQVVLDAVNPDTGGDIQLFDLQLNITADSTAVNEIEQRGTAIGANWSEEELDF